MGRMTTRQGGTPASTTDSTTTGTDRSESKELLKRTNPGYSGAQSPVGTSLGQVITGNAVDRTPMLNLSSFAEQPKNTMGLFPEGSTEEKIAEGYSWLPTLSTLNPTKNVFDAYKRVAPRASQGYAGLAGARVSGTDPARMGASLGYHPDLHATGRINVLLQGPSGDYAHAPNQVQFVLNKLQNWAAQGKPDSEAAGFIAERLQNAITEQLATENTLIKPFRPDPQSGRALGSKIARERRLRDEALTLREKAAHPDATAAVRGQSADATQELIDAQKSDFVGPTALEGVIPGGFPRWALPQPEISGPMAPWIPTEGEEVSGEWYEDEDGVQKFRVIK